MPRTIATNTAVDRDGLTEFLRPRHHMILLTWRRDGGVQGSPVTAGVDDDGPHRRGDLPGAGEGDQRRPAAAGVGDRALRGFQRAVGPGRRRRGADHPARRGGAARRLLPRDLGRALGLGRVPAGDGRPGQGVDPDHPDPLGTGRHRRISRPGWAEAARPSACPGRFRGGWRRRLHRDETRDLPCGRGRAAPTRWAPPTTARAPTSRSSPRSRSASSCACSSSRGEGDPGHPHRGRRVRPPRLPAHRRARPALRLPGARPLRPGPRACGATRPSCSSIPTRRPSTGPCSGTRPCSATRSAIRTSRNDTDSAPYVPKSVVVNPFFDWGTDRSPRIPYHETVIYEAHVRGPHDQPPRDPRGAARHLRGPRPPGDDRAPQAPGRHRRRAHAGARVHQRPPPAGEGPLELLGLQHHRLPGPAPRLRGHGQHGRAARCRSSRRWCATCTTRASR